MVRRVRGERLWKDLIADFSGLNYGLGESWEDRKEG
jgi:hypothetical protein